MADAQPWELIGFHYVTMKRMYSGAVSHVMKHICYITQGSAQQHHATWINDRTARHHKKVFWKAKSYYHSHSNCSSFSSPRNALPGWDSSVLFKNQIWNMTNNFSAGCVEKKNNFPHMFNWKSNSGSQSQGTRAEVWSVHPAFVDLGGYDFRQTLITFILKHLTQDFS